MGTGSIGFWGKIPSRGDFVAFGLSRGFIRAWDDFMSQALADSQAALGDGWQDAWMEAPVWRFIAGPDLLGPCQVAGLWMPSVDRAGRWFPLTFAAETGVNSAWLDAAEELGRTALESSLTPEQIAAALTLPSVAVDLPDPGRGSLWWTEGSPRVSAQQLSFAALPGAAWFVRMINGGEE